MSDIKVKVADNATHVTIDKLFKLVKDETGKSIFTMTTGNADYLVTFTRGRFGIIENKILISKR